VSTRVASLESVDDGALTSDIARMLEDGARLLAAEGVAVQSVQYLAGADLRYQGQNYELYLPLPQNALDEAGKTHLAQRFHSEHKRVYGYDLPHRAVQLVNLRLKAVGVMPPIGWPTAPRASGRVQAAGRREVMITPGRTEQVPVYRHAELLPAHCFAGPAIVEYAGSTLFVPPEWNLEYDEFRNARVTRSPHQESK
jgi:N-methylhydantoinase A